jgi:transcriptional regulator with XRE-family HTH domain
MTELARDLGRLVQAVRSRSGLSQELLAKRVGTTQQWLSRVERGATNPRLGEVQRIFDVLGLRLQLAAAPRPAAEDPDLLPEWSEADRDSAVGTYRYYLGRAFKSVDYVMAGRLAAVAQGAPVRVYRLDLAVAGTGLESVRDALAGISCTRWSERWQEFRDSDVDPRRPGPLRWLLAGFHELRLQVVDRLPVPLEVRACDGCLPVWPLADLERVDADVADVMRRVRARRAS